MAKSTTRRIFHRLACGGALLATLVPMVERPVLAASPRRPLRQQQAAPSGKVEAARSAAGAHDSGAQVRVNFMHAEWPDVLRKIAEETGSTLVMENAPRGKYTRVDAKKYPRSEAVRILNRDLEPHGYRIVEKDQFLVVLELDDVRSQYRRPVVRDMGTDGAGASQSAAPSPRRDRTHRLVKAEQEPGDESDRAVRRANLDDLANDDALTDRHPAEAAADESPADPIRLTVVEIEHRGAASVAKVLYSALKERSELLDDGPRGLPAFRTFREPSLERELGARRQASRSSHDPALFTVGIDSDREELVISAPEKLAARLKRLCREIDATPEDRASSLRVVSASDNALRIGQSLQPELDRLLDRLESGTAARPRRNADWEGPSGRRRNPIGDRGDLFAQNENQENRENKEQPGPPDLPDLIDSLRGDVAVEAMQDAGVLILRGNPKDVDAVMKVIREIEKLSAGATPQIHVHLLKHVNSDSFAVLLNSVYEKLSTMRNRDGQPRQQVFFYSLSKPNAVLILAPPVDMKSIVDLADQLDQPVDPEMEFQVFRLRNAVATQVVVTLTEMYRQREGEEGSGLRTRVTAYPDVRTNSVIVQARPRDLEEISALVHKIDQDESGSVNKLRIFPLQNALADDLAFIINTALQSVLYPQGAATRGASGGDFGGSTQPGGPGARGPGGDGPTTGGTGGSGQSSQALRDAKSVVLEFLGTQGGADRVVRSGVLADIRVTADARLNRLLVTAPEQSMQLMEELIRQLDQPSGVVAEIKVYPLQNGDAAAIVRLLQSLFGGRTGQQQQQQDVGLQFAGFEDPTGLLIPLRFEVDARTNSVIVIGGADAQVAVEAVILRLDTGEVRQRQNEVIKLKNSPALEVAEAINQFLQSQRDLAQLDPDLVSNVEFLEREIIAVPETVSNSLLISATPRYFEEIKKIVNRLDEAPPQVVIQALLVEVDLQNTDEFGVELGFQDSVLFDRSAIDSLLTVTESAATPGTGVVTTTERIISQQATPGFQFNNSPLGNNPAINSSEVGKQALSNFSLGRVNSDLGYGGLVLSAGSESVQVLLRALAARRTINILSRPQIRTLDNQEATIQVGQQVPIVNGVTLGTTGTANPNIVQDDAGIILSVRPRISPDGTIVMETRAEKSQFAGASVPVFTDVTTGNTVTSPIKDITVAHSTLSVPNGQTIVMGGMITKTDNTLERKVPCLGDLPLVGRAFRYDSTTTRRTELLIFLTPRIVRTDADNELIKQVEAERIHFLEEDAEAMHGPLFAVPAGQGAEPLNLPKLRDGNAPAMPPAPGLNPDDDDMSGVPTTIMPGNAFWSDEPELLEAGTTSVSDSGDELDGPNLLQPAGGGSREAAVSSAGKKPNLLKFRRSN